MKILLTALLILAPLSSATRAAPGRLPERAWKPFFNAFRAAVKKRDREALREMMTPDFYCSPGVGDDNRDGDARDDAFKFYDSLTYTNAWTALDKVLAKGSVPNTARGDKRSERLSRVAPPEANSRRAIREASFPWYAIFEFKKGRWYWTAFVECCD